MLVPSYGRVEYVLLVAAVGEVGEVTGVFATIDEVSAVVAEYRK